MMAPPDTAGKLGAAQLPAVSRPAGCRTIKTVYHKSICFSSVSCTPRILSRKKVAVRLALEMPNIGLKEIFWFFFKSFRKTLAIPEKFCYNKKAL